MNTYGYVGGNPSNSVDPYGLTPNNYSRLTQYQINIMLETISSALGVIAQIDQLNDIQLGNLTEILNIDDQIARNDASIQALKNLERYCSGLCIDDRNNGVITDCQYDTCIKSCNYTIQQNEREITLERLRQRRQQLMETFSK